MHVLANQHYLAEKEERAKDMPAHWSGPAERFQGSLTKLNESMAKAIDETPGTEAKLRTVLAAMHAEILQLRRMVSEGVILAMVRDEFWKQYAQVPVQVDDASKVIAVLQHVARVNHEILRAICRAQGLPEPLSIDSQLEAALKQAQEAARAA